MKTRRAEALWIEARKRWQINVQRDGVRKTFTDSTPGRQGKHFAEAKADKWLKKFSTEQRLCDAWELFMEDKQQQVTDSTITATQSRYNHITAVIPETKRLSMITLYEWQKVLDTMAADGYKASTIGLTLVTIKDLNNYALRRRWECEEIRTGDLTVPKQAEKPRQKKALSEASFKALYTLDDTDTPYIYLFQLLPLTGLRIGEARALEWTDIDTKNHALRLSRAVNPSGEITKGKTANAQRSIPLIPQAESILDEQRALLTRWHLSTPYIFPTLDNGKILTHGILTNAWNRTRKLIDTTCSIHELRHTFISISKNELPLSLLKQIVGHSSSMDTLKTYAHETEADIKQGKMLLEKAFAEL